MYGVHRTCAEMAAVSRGTSQVTTKARCKYTTSVEIQNTVTHVESHATKARSAREQRIAPTKKRKSSNQSVQIIRSKFVTVPPVCSSHCLCFWSPNPPTPHPPTPTTIDTSTPPPATLHTPLQKEKKVQVLVRVCVGICYGFQAHTDTQRITHHLGSCISNSEDLMVRKDTARLQNAESFAS